MGISVAEKSRLRRAAPEVRPGIEAHTGWLEQELDDLDTDQRVQRSSMWREKDDLLRSVPGAVIARMKTLPACAFAPARTPARPSPFRPTA